jgi:putative peptidoglycan lipid II flippase
MAHQLSQPAPKQALRTLIAMTLATFLSRLLGFIRDVMIARLFGTSSMTDAFILVFRLPNLVRRLFAEGTLALAFVPAINYYRHHHHPDAMRYFLGTMTGTFAVVLLFITICGQLLAPWLITVMAPGFRALPHTFAVAVEMLRMVFPYLFFIGLTALAGAILNTYHHFTLSALTPAILNIVLISCMMWLAPYLAEPIMALTWGILIAGCIQLTLQVPSLARLQLLSRLRIDLQDPTLRRLLQNLAPTLLGASVLQLNLLIDALFASYLPTGTMSHLYYAERMLEFPLGLLAAPLGIFIAPRLAQAVLTTASSAPNPAWTAILTWAERCVILLGVPALVGFLLLADLMITVLFASPQFVTSDIQHVTRYLLAYSLGLIPLMATKVLLPAFHAHFDVRTPMRIGIIACMSNLILNSLLMPSYGALGLAVATTLAALLQAVLLWYALRQHQPVAGNGVQRWPIARSLLAAGLMGLLLFLCKYHPYSWLQAITATPASALFVLILCGVVSYFVLLLILGWRVQELKPPVTNAAD